MEVEMEVEVPSVQENHSPNKRPIDETELSASNNDNAAR